MKSIKSISGKTSSLMIFLLIFVISVLIIKQVGLVKAQNESNITGYEIAGVNDTENFTFTQNLTDFNTSTVFDTNITNVSLNMTENITNVSENITLNETIETNETVSNETIENITSNETIENITSNETFENETISNETSQENFTINETLNETKAVLNFDINLIYPQKITRGEVIKLKAIATNMDSLTAKNVFIDWRIPEGFEIVSGNEREFCGNLEPESYCESEIELKTSTSTNLGLNEIKVVVNYE